jgi:hypothetical protein
LIIKIVNQILYNLLFQVFIMSKHLIYSSIPLVYHLSFITIESLNFINIQTEVNLYEKHKEFISSVSDINLT